MNPGNKQTARIATDVSIAIAAMIPTLRKRSCASSRFRPPTKSRPCPLPRRKSNCGAQFTRITPAAGGTGCAGVNTRNSQATGTAAATI